MIVVDTSALAAIVLGEPDGERFRDALEHATVAISAASVTEARIVLDSRAGGDALRDLTELLDVCEATITPYDEEHASATHAAWRRFGKGRHPAQLNLGDCMAYATAKLADAPLLFKGKDFTQTDITPAI